MRHLKNDMPIVAIISFFFPMISIEHCEVSQKQVIYFYTM